mgnify:CR=1 FL=1
MTIQQQNVIAALIGHMEVSNNNVTFLTISFLSSFLSKWDSIHSCDVRSRVILTSKKSKLSLLMVSREVQKNDIKKIKKADALGRSCS